MGDGVFMGELAESREVVAVAIEEVGKIAAFAAGFFTVQVDATVVPEAGCRVVKS